MSGTATTERLLKSERDGTVSSPRNASRWTDYGSMTAVTMSVSPGGPPTDGAAADTCGYCHTAADVSGRGGHMNGVKLTRLGETDNIESYFTTLERIMEVNEIGRECWPFQLILQPTERAQQAYAALTQEDVKNYDTVKAAIRKH